MKKMTQITYLLFQTIFRIFDNQSGIFNLIKPVDAEVMKTTSGISVKQALIVNEKKTMSAIMDEIKNMFDYKVGHYIKYEDVFQSNKNNVLRSFIFIKQKFFPNGNMDKLKARLVAD